jgi:hypothetical protein
MKNGLLEMMFIHPDEVEQIKEVNEVYNEARKKWTKENGSCLDAENYLDHWNQREDYIKNMLCLYYKSNNYCVRCSDEN